MTISTLVPIMNRIETASIHSPIAVFYFVKKGGEIALDAVFGSTISAINRIKHEHEDFVGLFNETTHKGYVRLRLVEALNGDLLKFRSYTPHEFSKTEYEEARKIYKIKM